MFGTTKTQISTPAYDRELFDAFQAGRLLPTGEAGEWYYGVLAGRLDTREIPAWKVCMGMTVVENGAAYTVYSYIQSGKRIVFQDTANQDHEVHADDMIRIVSL